MRKYFIFGLLILMVFSCFLGAEEYEEVINKEGDVNYISEPEKEGEDIMIKGYTGQDNNVIDDIRDDLEDREQELDEDMGFD
jgi:hypothetical protein